MGDFMFYLDRLETHLLQLFAHTQNSVWFSIILLSIFKVNTVAERNQA